MKTLIIFLFTLCSLVAYGQTDSGGDLLINRTQQDDTYLAGGNIQVNASIQGDLVIAGGSIIITDSINGDFTATAGEILISGVIADDARIAVGTVTIDSEIGDDLVVFGGELIITENAKINGNLKCFAGNVEIYGDVLGELAIKGVDVLIDGTVREASKITGEDITIGTNARFYQDVEYWSSAGEIDFKESLVDTEAQFNEALGEDKSQLSLTSFGTKSLALWVFYILSAFLVILVFHALFKNAFSNAVEDLEHNLLKSFGYGLIYLISIPLLIILALLMIIGIPLGLFITTVFIFSLLFGHLIAALLLVYYVKHKYEKDWGFWSITLLALLSAIVLRLLTIIPIAGVIISVIVLSITYGALTLKVLHSKQRLVEN